MKKMMSLCMVLVLMVSICSLAFANVGVEDPVDVFELKAKNDIYAAVGNDTGDPDGNETGDPDDNETEDPDDNETEEPDGNETEDPDGNESDIDDDTEEEIEIMNTTLGAEIRLLQLEKAITKNLLKGERAVTVLQVLEYNTTELETILDEMRLLLEEVQAANASANDSVQKFVDLKSDAKKLTKEFRETIKELLSDAKIKELKEQIREIVGEELQNYSKKIQNRIKQFNRNQIHRLYGIIGVTNELLADAYQDGNITMEEAKSQISKMVNMMTKEKKNQIFSELKKEKIDKKNYASEEAGDAMLNFEERQQNRGKDRSDKAKNGNNNGKGNGNSK